MLIETEDDLQSITEDEWSTIATRISQLYMQAVKYTRDQTTARILRHYFTFYLVDTIVSDEGMSDLKTKFSLLLNQYVDKAVTWYIEQVNDKSGEEQVEYINGFDDTNEAECFFDALEEHSFGPIRERYMQQSEQLSEEERDKFSEYLNDGDNDS